MPDPPQANLLVAVLVFRGPFDPRLSYVIFEGVIWSLVRGWRPRAYLGPNKHDSHIHVSFTPAGDEDGRDFALPLLETRP